MKLPFYTVKIVIADPNDEEIAVTINCEHVSREVLATCNVPAIAMAFEAFEDCVE